MLTLGSLAMLRALRRAAVVENSTASPSRSAHTTDVWGLPSAFSVATVAKFVPSRSSLAVSVSVIAIPAANPSRRDRHSCGGLAPPLPARAGNGGLDVTPASSALLPERPQLERPEPV